MMVYRDLLMLSSEISSTPKVVDNAEVVIVNYVALLVEEALPVVCFEERLLAEQDLGNFTG